jgi:hypothetical protein
MNRSRTFASIVSLTIALGALAGCQQEPSSEPVFTRTLVKVDEQGKVTYQQRDVTLSQQQRDKQLRELAERGLAASVVVDNSCAAASMWMFDQPGLNGNELCLFMYPKSRNYWSTSQLNIFPRGPFGSLGSWSRAVRSLWAGADAWRFDSSCAPSVCGCDGGPCPCEGVPWERLDSVSGCVSYASMVSLTCPSCSQ